LRDVILFADTTNVPTIVEDIVPYRRWIDPLLREANYEAKVKEDRRAQPNTSLALLPVDAGQVEYLFTRLLDAEPEEFPVIQDALVPHSYELVSRLWKVVEHPAQGKENQRLRAACALAKYDPQNERWAAVAEPVVDDFVSVSPAYLKRWMDC